MDTLTMDVVASEAAASDATGTDLGIADVPTPPVSNDPTISQPFTRCDKDADCGSGMFCVDGVCCDSKCEETCHSCALLSNPGHCTLEPAGVDLRNECGPAHQCVGTCGGNGQCIGAGAGTMCARNICTSQSQGEGPAYCAAPGAECPSTGVAFDCSPYVCEPAFGACRSNCATSADCVTGYVCDTTSKSCVVQAASSGGGCSTTGRGSTSSTTWLLAAGLAIAARARRAKRQSN